MEWKHKNKIHRLLGIGASGLFLGIFTLNSPVFGAGPGTSAMSFVNLVSSVRGASLANATTAINSIDGYMTNPSGVANQRAPAVRLQLMNYVDSGRFYQVVASVPFGYGVVGGDIGVFDYGQQSRTTFSDRSGSEGDSFGARSQKLGITYAAEFSGITVGTTVSQLMQVLDSQSLTAWGVDVGATYPVSSTLRVGVAMTQLTFKGQQSGSEYRPLPSAGRVGVVWTSDEWAWPTLISTDLVAPSDEALYVQGGIESNINPAVAMRVGYTSRAVFSQLSTGIGINIGDVGVDFSYHPSSQLGNFYRVGVGFKW